MNRTVYKQTLRPGTEEKLRALGLLTDSTKANKVLASLFHGMDPATQKDPYEVPYAVEHRVRCATALLQTTDRAECFKHSIPEVAKRLEELAAMAQECAGKHRAALKSCESKEKAGSGVPASNTQN